MRYREISVERCENGYVVRLDQNVDLSRCEVRERGRDVFVATDLEHVMEVILEELQPMKAPIPPATGRAR